MPSDAIVQGLLDAACACLYAGGDKSEVRSVNVGGYAVDVAVKTVPHDDPRRSIHDRRLMILLRVDREAARAKELAASDDALDHLLRREIIALEALFRPQGNRRPLLPSSWDLSTSENPHFDTKRHRCALWYAGPAIGRHFAGDSDANNTA